MNDASSAIDFLSAATANARKIASQKLSDVINFLMAVAPYSRSISRCVLSNSRGLLCGINDHVVIHF